MLLGFVEQLIPHQLPGAANDSRTELLGDARVAAYSTFPPASPERVPNIPPELLSPAVSAISLRDDSDLSDGAISDDEASHAPRQRKKFDREALVRTLKTQVWTGALLGLAAAAVVGAVFLYVVCSPARYPAHTSFTPLRTTSGKTQRTSGRASSAALPL